MAGFIKKSAEHSEALARVRAVTRERFRLAEDDVLTVAELACSVPGCPPLETVIAFWSGGRRHHLKVFKPAADVSEEDLPPWWLKGSFAVPADYECGCC